MSAYLSGQVSRSGFNTFHMRIVGSTELPLFRTGVALSGPARTSRLGQRRPDGDFLNQGTLHKLFFSQHARSLQKEHPSVCDTHRAREKKAPSKIVPNLFGQRSRLCGVDKSCLQWHCPLPQD